MLYSIGVVVVVVLAGEGFLLALPLLRRTRWGRWAETLLKHGLCYRLGKSFYWSLTPAVLRRWFGRSRASSFGDFARYSRNHTERISEITEIKAKSKLLQEDMTGYELWATPEGSWWIPSGESSALFELVAEQRIGIYETNTCAVRAGDIVLDCGANVGCYSRHALSLGAKCVVAIEPAPDSLECLRRNLADEIVERRVIVYSKGVWDRDESLLMSGSGVGRRITNKKSDGVEGALKVLLTTIDRLVADLDLRHVDFIKMDIEGAERSALLGARHTLLEYGPRLAIAGYHNREDSETIPGAVLSARSGYHLQYGTFYHPGWVRPQTLFFYI